VNSITITKRKHYCVFVIDKELPFLLKFYTNMKFHANFKQLNNLENLWGSYNPPFRHFFSSSELLTASI